MFQHPHHVLVVFWRSLALVGDDKRQCRSLHLPTRPWFGSCAISDGKALCFTQRWTFYNIGQQFRPNVHCSVQNRHPTPHCAAGVPSTVTMPPLQHIQTIHQFHNKRPVWRQSATVAFSVLHPCVFTNPSAQTPATFNVDLLFKESFHKLLLQSGVSESKQHKYRCLPTWRKH